MMLICRCYGASRCCDVSCCYGICRLYGVSCCYGVFNTHFCVSMIVIIPVESQIHTIFTALYVNCLLRHKIIVAPAVIIWMSTACWLHVYGMSTKCPWHVDNMSVVCHNMYIAYLQPVHSVSTCLSHAGNIAYLVMTGLQYQQPLLMLSGRACGEGVLTGVCWMMVITIW